MRRRSRPSNGFNWPPTKDIGRRTFRANGSTLRCRRRMFRKRCAASLPLSVAKRRRSPNKDRKSTRLNSSHQIISYAVFCLKKKKQKTKREQNITTEKQQTADT